MITYKNLNNIPIAGRLGNNLFQIATVIGLALKHGVEYVFPTWRYKDYFPKLPFDDLALKRPFHEIHEKHTYYQNIVLNPKLDYNLSGYFQSYKYFDNYKEIIKELLTPNIKFENSDNVAVHVRRGDYLNFPHVFRIMGMDYYNRAMSLFPNRIFSIFSDDIKWCIDNFRGDNIIFIQPGNDIEDFSYMMSHKDFIISNSTFSWWAAYLCKDENKVVVSPKSWFLTESRIDDRIPNSWVLI